MTQVVVGVLPLSGKHISVFLAKFILAGYARCVFLFKLFLAKFMPGGCRHGEEEGREHGRVQGGQ